MQNSNKQLATRRYEFAIADLKLPDAPNGEIIPLLNKHNISPIVFTSIIDDDFREGFESAHMDGLKFLRTIRKTKSKKDLSVLMLSPNTNSYITSKFLKDGVNDYITKPFSRDEFYTRIYQNIKTTELF